MRARRKCSCREHRTERRQQNQTLNLQPKPYEPGVTTTGSPAPTIAVAPPPPPPQAAQVRTSGRRAASVDAGGRASSSFTRASPSSKLHAPEYLARLSDAAPLPLHERQRGPLDGWRARPRFAFAEHVQADEGGEAPRGVALREAYGSSRSCGGIARVDDRAGDERCVPPVAGRAEVVGRGARLRRVSHARERHVAPAGRALHSDFSST